ncbi:MAG: AEC family transporter, partial [Pseudomonadota bacterium]
MSSVSVLIEIIVPVFGVVAIGFLVAKMRWMADSAVEGLSQFVFNIAIPVLLFRTMAQTELPEIQAFGHLASYFGAVAVIFGTAMALGRLVFSMRLVEMAIFGMCASFSNSILIGIPLVLLAFGDEATLPLFFIISIHGVVLFAATTVLAEVGLGRGERLSRLPFKVAKRLFANPILIGLALGLVVNAVGLTLPTVVDRLAETLGAAALPCATFAMGASISRFKLAGALPQVGLAMMLK